MEATFDTKRKELGVEDSLKDLPGVTTRMLIAPRRRSRGPGDRAPSAGI